MWQTDARIHTHTHTHTSPLASGASWHRRIKGSDLHEPASTRLRQVLGYGAGSGAFEVVRYCFFSVGAVQLGSIGCSVLEVRSQVRVLKSVE